jgi:hypothetical protein
MKKLRLVGTTQKLSRDTEVLTGIALRKIRVKW